MADVARTSPADAAASHRFSSAGSFERAPTAAGWEFRSNEASARLTATVHAGCLTLPAVVSLGACGWFAGTLVGSSAVGGWGGDRSAVIAGVGCGLALLGSAPVLVAWARHVYRKSLRDNWLIMGVSPGGPVRLGEQILVDAGRARRVVVRTMEEGDGEGGTATTHCVEVVEARECAAPARIPIPLCGLWHPAVRDRRTAEAFAGVLAAALGVSVREPPAAPETR